MIPLFKVAMSATVMDSLPPVLMSGYIGQGPKVAELETRLTKYLDAYPGILATNSCTSAISLALHLCEVGPGDEVITTPMTCTATNSPIVTSHAIPVWADIDPYTGLIDPADVKKKISSKTKAIVVVDWGGRYCDYSTLKQFGLPVIQDAAHCFLELPVECGDYACWSFQAIKFLTTGDGGALMPAKEKYARAKLLRWYGLDRTSDESFRCKQNIAEVGYKYHMNDIAATIGLSNFEKAIWAVTKTVENASYYLASINNKNVQLPANSPNCSWWLFTLLLKNRDAFAEHMKRKGIATSQVHARNDIHHGFRKVAKSSALPGVDYFSSHELAIPVGWWLTDEDRRYIVDAVNNWSGE